MGIARACFRGLAECVLFLFSILQALAGAAFVTFSILLANPPSSGIALALVIFGSVMLGAAVFGMLTSSCPRQCCLVFYILIGIALTIVQLIIVLVMIIDPQKVINNLISSCQTVGNCQGITSNAQRVNDLVYTGRWVLLGWVCAQAVCLVLAIMLCTCCKKGRRRYNDFDEDPEVAAARERLRAVQMQNMAMEQGAAGNTNGVSRKNLNGAKSTPLSSQDYNNTAADIAARYNLQPQNYDANQQFMTQPYDSPPPAQQPPSAGAWGASGNVAAAPKGAW